MSHSNESKTAHAIPTVAWHEQGSQKRPGVLRPLPLPIHPEVPHIPGGLPGTVGKQTFTYVSPAEAIPGRSGLVYGGIVLVPHPAPKPRFAKPVLRPVLR
jgi:hypothetical protein